MCMYDTIHLRNSHCLTGYTDHNNSPMVLKDQQWASMFSFLHNFVVAYNRTVPSMHCFLSFLLLSYVRWMLLCLNMVPNDEVRSYVLKFRKMKVVWERKEGVVIEFDEDQRELCNQSVMDKENIKDKGGKGKVIGFFLVPGYFFK